jgi:hypothetical protein
MLFSWPFSGAIRRWLGKHGKRWPEGRRCRVEEGDHSILWAKWATAGPNVREVVHMNT